MQLSVAQEFATKQHSQDAAYKTSPDFYKKYNKTYNKTITVDSISNKLVCTNTAGTNTLLSKFYSKCRMTFFNVRSPVSPSNHTVFRAFIAEL